MLEDLILERCSLLHYHQLLVACSVEFNLWPKEEGIRIIVASSNALFELEVIKGKLGSKFLYDNSTMQRSAYLECVQKTIRDGLASMDPLSPKFEAKGVVPPRFKAHFSPESAHRSVLKAAFEESCLIETTSDSMRCNFRLKKQDALEEILVSSYMRVFSMEEASSIRIVQRLPLSSKNTSLKKKEEEEEGKNDNGGGGGGKNCCGSDDSWDISFLITNRHVRDFGLDEIVSSVLHFLTHIDKEKADMKIRLNANGRKVARDFWE